MSLFFTDTSLLVVCLGYIFRKSWFIFYSTDTSISHTRFSSLRRSWTMGQVALEKMPQSAEAATEMHASLDFQGTLERIHLDQEHGQHPEDGTENKTQDEPHPKDNKDQLAEEPGVEEREQDESLKDPTANGSGQDAVTQTDKEAAGSREEQNKKTALVFQIADHNQNNLDILRAMNKFQKSIETVRQEVKAIGKAQHEARKEVSKLQSRLDAE